MPCPTREETEPVEEPEPEEAMASDAVDEATRFLTYVKGHEEAMASDAVDEATANSESENEPKRKKRTKYRFNKEKYEEMKKNGKRLEF